MYVHTYVLQHLYHRQHVLRCCRHCTLLLTASSSSSVFHSILILLHTNTHQHPPVSPCGNYSPANSISNAVGATTLTQAIRTINSTHEFSPHSPVAVTGKTHHQPPPISPRFPLWRRFSVSQAYIFDDWSGPMMEPEPLEALASATCILSTVPPALQ